MTSLSERSAQAIVGWSPQQNFGERADVVVGQGIKMGAAAWVVRLSRAIHERHYGESEHLGPMKSSGLEAWGIGLRGNDGVSA